jgi:putative inorganic carbon (HCO3(-)) transporter
MDNNCNAIAMVTCVGLAFFLGLYSSSWWQKALALAAALFMAHAIFFSFSRGAMLALLIVGLVSFALVPKEPKYILLFAVAGLLAARMAGPQVVKRFETAFADSNQRDASAQSRLDLWAACCDTMVKEPLGVGPAHWGLVVEEYGFPRGKMAHTLWLQIGAELGFPGLFALLFFYLVCMVRLWPLAWGSVRVADPWFRHLACMVIAALAGFMVSAQFVSLYGLEVPYYIVLLGAGVLKLTSAADSSAVVLSQESGASHELSLAAGPAGRA